MPESRLPTPTRRTVLRTSAWSVPAISLATTAPAFAASGAGSIGVVETTGDATTGVGTVTLLLTPPPPSAPALTASYSQPATPRAPVVSDLGPAAEGRLYRFDFTLAQPPTDEVDVEVTVSVPGYAAEVATVTFTPVATVAGALDAAFAAALIADGGLDGQVLAAVRQPDGAVVLGGTFTSVDAALSVTANLVRFAPDGTLDTAFSTALGTGPVSTVRAIVVQDDGRLVVGGDFLTLNGVTVNRLARLNADGTLDTDFTSALGPGGLNGGVQALLLGGDGTVVVGGSFTTVGGVSAPYLARLGADGRRDTAFTTALGGNLNSSVVALARQADGRILVGGTFTTVGSAAAGRLLRLETSGARDTAFTTNLGTGFNTTVSALVVQTDGNIVVGGSFTTLGSTTVNRLVRLGADGTRDAAFTAALGTGFNGTVSALALYTDGRIVVGGSFTTLGSATVNRLVRLEPDGSREATFSTNLGTGFNSTVSTFVVEPDGRVLVGGAFVLLGTTVVNRLVRLEPDGTIAPGYTGVVDSQGFVGSVTALVTQPDGKILVGGSFVYLGRTTVNRLVRLNPDGTLDAGFTAAVGAGPNGNIAAVVVQPDGKIVAGGGFSTFGGSAAGALVRLNADGSRDTAFTTALGTGFNSSVLTLAVQPDGRIVAGGGFSTLAGATANRLARLNADGSRDTAFGAALGTGFNGTVSTVAVQPDGKIVAGGAFNVVSGTNALRLARLNADGSRDAAFATALGTSGFNNTVSAVVVQPDGKIVVGGSFTTAAGANAGRLARLNADGSRDTAFTTALGAGFNTTVSALALQAGGRIVAGGYFSTLTGATANRLARLEADGSRDAVFAAALGTGFDSIVSALAVQPDAQLLVGGAFARLGPKAARRLARLS